MAFNFPFNFLRPSSPSLLPSVTAQSRHRFYMASHKFQSQSTEAKAKSSEEKITFEIIVNMNKKRKKRSLSYETVKLDENETRKSRTTTRTTTTAMSIQLKARLGCCLFFKGGNVKKIDFPPLPCFLPPSCNKFRENFHLIFRSFHVHVDVAVVVFLLHFRFDVSPDNVALLCEDSLRDGWQQFLQSSSLLLWDLTSFKLRRKNTKKL